MKREYVRWHIFACLIIVVSGVSGCSCTSDDENGEMKNNRQGSVESGSDAQCPGGYPIVLPYFKQISTQILPDTRVANSEIEFQIRMIPEPTYIVNFGLIEPPWVKQNYLRWPQKYRSVSDLDDVAGNITIASRMHGGPEPHVFSGSNVSKYISEVRSLETNQKYRWDSRPIQPHAISIDFRYKEIACAQQGISMKFVLPKAVDYTIYFECRFNAWIASGPLYFAMTQNEFQVLEHE